MAAIEITMLGGFQIRVKGKPVLAQLNQSRKVLLLLEYLILQNGAKVPHKHLTDALWGSDSSSNPDMALRAILHRFRTMVDQEGLEELQDCILTSRGAYQWNTALDCEIDVNRLSLLYEELQVEKLESKRETLCSDIVELYRGRLLPASAGEPWVEGRSVQLHSRYQTALYELLNICKKRELYPRADKLYARALELDPYDERLYLGRMLVLERLGRKEEADRLARQGAERGCLSDAARHQATDSMYRQMMQADLHTRAGIETVAEELDRAGQGRGAYLCSYEVLNGIYQVQRRIEARHGLNCFLAMITLIPPKGASEGEQARVMEVLQGVMCRTLRSCDVVAEYSSTQYLVLLSGSDENGAPRPMERIKTAFYNENLPGGYLISYHLHAPEIPQGGPACRRTAGK